MPSLRDIVLRQRLTIFTSEYYQVLIAAHLHVPTLEGWKAELAIFDKYIVTYTRLSPNLFFVAAAAPHPLKNVTDCGLFIMSLGHFPNFYQLVMTFVDSYREMISGLLSCPITT